jgi:hypothetical protein
MNDLHGSTGARQYEIRLKGHLEARWAAWFEELSLSRENDGTTVIRGSVVDQAALHGLLSKVRDLGLPLIAVNEIEPEQPNGTDVNADTDHNRCDHASANT